jgi:hypothetical protein
MAKLFQEKPCSLQTKAMYRTPRSRAHLLFCEHDFFSVQTHQQELLSDAIAKTDQRTIADADVKQMALDLSQQFSLSVPRLVEGAISMTAEEAQANVAGDIRYGAFGPGPHLVPGIEVSYYIPFVGDKRMFTFRPSTWSGNIPGAELGDSELRITFVRPGQDVAATRPEFDRQLSLIKQHLGWLEENCRTLNQSLPVLARREITARKSRLEQMTQSAESMGVLIRRAAAAGAQTARVRNLPVQSAVAASAQAVEKYDVALSFAGENRAYVEEVAVGLRNAGVSVFYDAFEKADLWGKNLIEHLADIYGNRSRFVVMFISKEYVEKAWTKHERRHAQERALLAQQEYILPARFDDTPVPGMTATIAFQDLRQTTPSELVKLIAAKLGK